MKAKGAPRRGYVQLGGVVACNVLVVNLNIVGHILHFLDVVLPAYVVVEARHHHLVVELLALDEDGVVGYALNDELVVLSLSVVVPL